MMKKLFTMALTLLIVLVSVQSAEARHLTYPSLSIRVEIRADGSARVSEERCISFHGKYEGFYQYIYTGKGIEINNIRVREGSVEYAFNPGGSIGPPGTYFVRSEEDRVLIDWSVEAAYESRTFVLEYDINNLVSVYDDYATFYHQFVGDEWAEGVENLTVSIMFPQSLSKEQVSVWAYGPAHGLCRINEDGRVTLTVDGLPAYTFIESRVVFPREVVSESSNIVPGKAAPIVTGEAEQWARGLEKARKGRAVSTTLSPVLFGLALLILAYCYWHKHREKKHYYLKNGDYFRELPSDISPILVLALLHDHNIRGHMNKGISAAILKLAVDGFIHIEETNEQKGAVKRRKQYTFRLSKRDCFTEADDFARLILSMLFEVISPDGETVSTKDIEDFKKSETSTTGKQKISGRVIFGNEVYMAVFNRELLEGLTAGQGKLAEAIANLARAAMGDISLNLNMLVKNLAQLAETELREKHRYLTVPLFKPVPVLLALAAVVAIGAGYSFIFNYSSLSGGDWTAIIAVAGIVFYLWAGITILAVRLSRKTDRGKEEYYKWLAFKRYLKDFSSLDEKEIPHLVLWDKYLVYATAMGIAKNVIDNLKRIYPEAADTSNRSWCTASPGTSIFSGSFTGSMAGALPSSGSGGGMSGGGGGGSGGGGGGGR